MLRTRLCMPSLIQTLLNMDSERAMPASLQYAICAAALGKRAEGMYFGTELALDKIWVSLKGQSLIGLIYKGLVQRSVDPRNTSVKICLLQLASRTALNVEAYTVST